MIMMKNIWKSNLCQMTSYDRKTIEIPSIVIAVRAVFRKNNKYYPQMFLDECLYKL